MATQLMLWNAAPIVNTVWNDVRLPDAYAEFFAATGSCINCRQPLRHYMHALNHFKKLHMMPKHRHFVYKFGEWNEIPKTAYQRALAKRSKGLVIALARTNTGRSPVPVINLQNN